MSDLEMQKKDGVWQLSPEALTTTPGASQSETVAKGKIADLAARDPQLAAKLSELGAQLHAAGVRHVPDNDIARG